MSLTVSASQEFLQAFSHTLRAKYESRLREKKGSGELCPFNNQPYGSVYTTIGYLYCMRDDELADIIDECIDNGYATQSEIAKVFKLKSFIIDKRIEIAERFLQTKWHTLIKNISENYPLILPSDIVKIVQDKEGKDKDIGVGRQVRELASRGLDRTEICELLRINPAVFHVYPKIDLEFRAGEGEARQIHLQRIERVLKNNLIRNNWFEENGLPTWKKLAEGFTVQVVKDEFQVNEDGEHILLKRTVQDKYIPPDKDALKKLTQLSGTELLNSNLAKRPEIESGSDIRALPESVFDENGRYIVTDAEFEEIHDDK